MCSKLNDKKIAFLVTDRFEQSEFTQPWEAMKAEGAVVELVSLKKGEILGTVKDEPQDSFKVDKTVDEVSASDYDGLVLPGGVVNPDALRVNEKAVQFVKDFAAQKKPIAAICHGPAMLIEADIVRGRTLTSWPSLKTDIRNAGGSWVDEEVVSDQGLVTSRKPEDLNSFCAIAIEAFETSNNEQTPRAA